MERGENLRPYLPGVNPQDSLLDTLRRLCHFTDFQLVLLT